MKLLTTIVVLAVAVGCAPASPDVAPGVSRALAEYRAASLRNVRYALHFRVPERMTDSVHGTARVSFDRSGAGPVVLDFVDAASRLGTVHANGAPVTVEAVDQHIVVPASALRDGENAIELAFVAGDLSLNRNDEYLYTLFVPDRARFAFPVFDQPDLKARFRLTLTVPTGWTAVANAPAENRTTDTRAVTVRFAETQPISTYLFAFAAGRFSADSTQRDGRWLRMYHRETDTAKVARNRDAVFDLHGTALRWLETYTDTPYPFGKFDFVLIPAFQYGGMEHPGAVYYRDASVLLDESATQHDLLRRASLIAHETAHMWFGDLVTMTWFDDVWTKEVFANFMAAKIVNPSFPEVDHELRFLLAHHPAAYEVDRSGGANPIRQPLDNLDDAGSLYGAIIYQKAPIVMRQLEARVGIDTFRDGLREYLRTYAFDNATWPDLIRLLDARTSEDLAAWSQVWVEEPGRPRVTTRVATAGGRMTTVRLEQEDPLKRARRWPQRLRVLLDYPDSALSVEVDLAGRTADVPGAPGLPAPRFVLANADGMGYAAFRPDSTSLAYLSRRLPAVADPMTRGVAWITLWDAMLEGRMPPAALVDLVLEALPAETSELNTELVLGYLTSAYWRFLTPAQQAARQESLEGLVWALLDRTSSTSRKASYLSAYRSLARTHGAVRRLERLWRRTDAIPGLPFAERDFTALALELAVREAHGWEAILEAQRNRITQPDRRARFEFVMPAVSADQTVRDAFFQRLADPAAREHEPWVLQALRYLHHPLRQREAERYLLPSLELVEEIQRTGDIFFHSAGSTPRSTVTTRRRRHRRCAPSWTLARTTRPVCGGRSSRRRTVCSAPPRLSKRAPSSAISQRS